MRARSWGWLFALTLSLLSAQSAMAAKESEELTTVKRLAALMGQGRKIVTAWQGTINDPSKGDKGFTAEQFYKELSAAVKESDIIDLDKTAKKKDTVSTATTAMVEAMKTVIGEAQPIINKQGMGFKGFLPAVFARKTFEAFNEKSNVKGKLTAAVFRNAKNAPDEWEKEALKNFLDRAKDDPKREAPIFKVVKEDGGEVLRFIKPEFYKGKCLDCHGNPKGERDISGGIKEGFEEGAAGAGLSFKVPVKK